MSNRDAEYVLYKSRPKFIPILKGRLQSKYKFVLKAAFLYADIPAKTNFSEKFMF